MDTIEYQGLTFRVTQEHDHDHGAPWDEEDGHGEVSDWTRRDKKPGERVLCDDRGQKRFYNFAGAVKTARAEWGVGPEVKAAFLAKHGREMTRGEIAVHAAESDYEYLRRWCDNQWSYVGVCVELLDVDGQEVGKGESLWGIDSDADEYLAQVAQELAEECAHGIARNRKNLKVGNTIYRIRD